MSGAPIAFTVRAEGRSILVPVTISQAVIAGWTGRDAVARDKHIAELEAVGVPRPASTPIYYRVAASRITTADRIEVSGGDSSGEVEFVLLRDRGRTYVGVGSDHTDRKVETYNITVSKQMCDKPVAPELWEAADVAGHWDALFLRSWAIIEGSRLLYQEGPLAGMLDAADLVARGFGAGGLPDGAILFGGTLPARGGIRPASRFEFELEDPVRGRSIRHGYDVVSLPIVG